MDHEAPWWMRLDGVPPSGARRRRERIAACKPPVGRLWPASVLTALVVGGGQIVTGHPEIAIALWVIFGAASALGTLIGRALTR